MPFEMPDDGLRLIKVGVIQDGTKRGAEYRCLENPGLIADVIATRRHREILNSHSIRWS